MADSGAAILSTIGTALDWVGYIFLFAIAMGVHALLFLVLHYFFRAYKQGSWRVAAMMEESVMFCLTCSGVLIPFTFFPALIMATDGHNPWWLALVRTLVGLWVLIVSLGVIVLMIAFTKAQVSSMLARGSKQGKDSQSYQPVAADQEHELEEGGGDGVSKGN